MGDEKIDPQRIRRILSTVFAQNPLAHDAVVYRFGLEDPKGSSLEEQRPLDEISLLLGLGDITDTEEILNDALRKLRGS